MEQLTVTETATRKGCSVQAVRDAIKMGRLDAEMFGKTYILKCNAKWQRWEPMAVRQAAGRSRWKIGKKGRG